MLSLPALVAPTKVLIVPLSAKDEFDPLIEQVCVSLLFLPVCPWIHDA